MGETETVINLFINDILQTSKNEDIFDALSVILHQDNWHNFKSRLLEWNSSEKLRQFFKGLFFKSPKNVRWIYAQEENLSWETQIFTFKVWWIIHTGRIPEAYNFENVFDQKASF